MHSDKFSRADVAALAPIVLEVANRGDEVALSIVWRQMHLLERQIRAVVNRLEMNDDEYHIAMAGGILSNNDLFRTRLLAELCVPEDRAMVIDEPAQGAVLLAADLVW